MVSLCYNIGPQTFAHSTLVARLNAGDQAGAAAEFLTWDKGTVSGVKQAIPYLTGRRKREQSLFLDTGPNS
jgi:lysozyme